MKETVLNLLEQNGSGARSLRKYLHENPELGSQEYATAKLMKSYAEELGLEIVDTEPTDLTTGTGFIAILDTGRPGKTLGLRTELDALPVKENENNLNGKRPIISKNIEAMHACAHDGYMTTLIYSMKMLYELKDQLSGRIIFIFEEAEELATGVHPMVNLLRNYEIDAIYGNHFASFVEVGKVAVDPGPVMAAASLIDFKVIGKGGHGSRPDLSANPLFAGVDIVNSISTAWNNQLDVEETVTLGLSQFNVGKQANVIDDVAHIGGSIRYFNAAEGEKATELIKTIAQNVAPLHKCRVEFSNRMGPVTLPLINDDELAKLAQDSVEELFPGHLMTDVNWFASETYSYYGELAPLVFSFVGIKDEEYGSGAEHHNEYFDMHDDALKYGIGTMVNFTMNYLGNN